MLLTELLLIVTTPFLELECVRSEFKSRHVMGGHLYHIHNHGSQPLSDKLLSPPPLGRPGMAFL